MVPDQVEEDNMNSIKNTVICAIAAIIGRRGRYNFRPWRNTLKGR